MNLVEIKGKKLLASTLVIAKGVEIEHRAVIQLVNKYKSRLEKNGLMTFEMRKSAGRPVRFAWLNERQATFLITLMKNSDTVVDFKEKLTDEYFRLKEISQKLALNQKNEEWLQKRDQGKISRKIETDTIKDFVSYAENQGSKNAKKYYVLISKMENKALFFLEQKYPNVRNSLQGHQLETISNADRIVSRQLKRCIDENRPYQEGYKMAKNAIEAFSDLIGKTLVPSMEIVELPL